MRYGYTLYCEGNDPRDLIKQAVMAEQAGFDFLVISDHYHPWLPEQSHSGFAWSILGAVAQATAKIKLATMVTCPIMRYHPVIVAQMAATMGVISGGRFTLGLGAGERLNEHVVGMGWPAVGERHRMLSEAIEIIQRLWQGGYTSFDGEYFTVEDARVFDLPPAPIGVFVAASGSASAKIAAEAGGICVTEPKRPIISAYTRAGGRLANAWGQVVLAWAPEAAQGLAQAHANFRFSAGGWKVQAELPNPVNFAAATKNVRQEDLAQTIPAGSEPTHHLQAIQQYADTGIQNIAVAYPGRDHQGFMNFWSRAMRPKLA